MKRPTITVFTDASGSWRWRLQTRNGKIIADSSEGYASRRNAVRAAEALLKVCSGEVLIRER